jgi:hypothetical protein
LGSSIEPEKASVKSASTPYPPWKVKFIVILSIFNSSLPRLNISWQLLLSGIVLSSHLFGPQSECLLFDLDEFFCCFSTYLWAGVCFSVGLLCCVVDKSSNNRSGQPPPKRGVYRRSSRKIVHYSIDQAIIRDPISHLYH